MKDFVRNEPLFSLCGLNCGLCVMHMGGYCPGCGGGEGNQSCSIAKCSIAHGNLQYCFQCKEYPCVKYVGMDEYDSFVPHRNRQKDFEKVQQIGIECYLQELQRKIDILEQLLEKYNDGRHKTFFAAAVYLLELPDLQTVMQSLENQENIWDLSPKERTSIVVNSLENLANQRKIQLKLIKKPKNTK